MLIYAKIMGKINALIKIIFECFCGHLNVHTQLELVFLEAAQIQWLYTSHIGISHNEYNL